MERLQKAIAKAGLASRRKAEELILQGKVKVDGVVITQVGTIVESHQTIEVEGKVLKTEELVYYVINKPTGYLSTTSDEHKRRTVVDLIPSKERIFPIGRLDYDTSGVLLLTNDGDFMNALIHPKFKVEKEYAVKVKGLLRKEESAILRKGVKLPEFEAQPAKIFDVRYDDKKEYTNLHIIITEGKYHQIKKMFEAIGHPVVKLRRARFGNITCEGLKQGEFRRLRPHEIKVLWHLSNFGKQTN